MALSPRIELRQSQNLVMTPQLQQAIRLLQMSNLELAEFVAAEIERNPLLEARPPAAAPPPPRGAAAAGAGNDLPDVPAGAATLRDHLLAQVGAMRAAPGALAAARALIEELDDDGYLRTPEPEIAARHRLAEGDVTAGLRLLHACDPAGIGARDLKECLRLQLADAGRLNPPAAALIDNLELLARHRLADLQSLCGVGPETLAEMRAMLRRLDPRPGQRFTAEPSPVVVPDIFVTRSASGGLNVELNTETLPRVLVDNAYAAEVAARGAAARAFISECSARANWLVRSLEQRARTILRVASLVVEHQERFFAGGATQLRPLTQRLVAERVNLHESTVSRVTAGKFLSCDLGCFELRYFFSQSIQGLAGAEPVSAQAVQERLRRLIQNENPGGPLSDDRLVALLKAEGIDIARRTVAKYREGLGIPSSVERRRSKSGLAGRVEVSG